jgi:chemotaxis protein histidine kinase CheA
MDFMFEDEADEVGSDVEAYCPKCKADTTHVVISKYEEEIRRVQCNPCGDVHSFRKPRGETEDDVPEPVSARKRAALKKLTWEEFFAKKSQNDAKPYEFRERYRENLIVRHPKFGVGFVSEVVSDSKVEISFQDARRILVHNRRDIPGLPLAAEGDGVPTPPKSEKSEKPEKSAKAAKEAAAKEAPAAKAAKEAAAKEAPSAKAAKPAKPEAAEKAAKPEKVEKPAPAEKEAKAPNLKLVPAAKADGKAEAKAESKAAKAPAKPAAAKHAKAPAKAASKPTPKAAAPRGGKTAAKPAAKKPPPRPKKKAGKKR